MTEDEAKNRWCFHFVASHTDPRMPPSQYERDELGNASPFRHNCIGSACMAWRHKGYVTLRQVDQLSPIKVAEGYCGLAGYPQ